MSSKINQLQLLQQNLQAIAAQKQQIESQQVELDSALSAIKDTEKSYKILGNVMVSVDKEALSKELNEKKERFDIHIKNISKQEEKLKKDIEKLQKEVMEELNKK